MATDITHKIGVKAVITNYRYWVLLIVCGLCVVLLMLDVDDTKQLPAATFAYIVVSSKVLAIGAGYLYWKLYKRWEAKGTIPELVNFNKQ